MATTDQSGGITVQATAGYDEEFDIYPATSETDVCSCPGCFNSPSESDTSLSISLRADIGTGLDTYGTVYFCSEGCVRNFYELGTLIVCDPDISNDNLIKIHLDEAVLISVNRDGDGPIEQFLGESVEEAVGDFRQYVTDLDRSDADWSVDGSEELNLTFTRF